MVLSPSDSEPSHLLHCGLKQRRREMLEVWKVKIGRSFREWAP